MRIVHDDTRLKATAVAVMLCFANSGAASSADDSSSEKVPDAAAIEYFEKNVRPLLVEHCYECHSAKDVNGGLRLDAKGPMLKGGDSGAAFVAGDPEKSLLIEAVRYKNRDLQMPPQNKLTSDQIGILEKWVSMGAPDPRTDASAANSGPTGMSIEDGKQFWSFRPVADPAVPTVKQNDWVKSPIDAFILRSLEAQGFQPAPLADKRTLIRRVTFDLTGLPPTPEEVAAFLEDDSEDAFAKVVDRLLSSPHYGVHWGRHWLDVARYADSNGLDENLAFGQAWRYRDYVVDSFNKNKPFNRFLVEQIAGDLLPNADRETKTATGFLVLGAKVLAEPDMEKLVMDTIDEQLDTVGKAFMGMTIGCVRCHDHKFDPLKQTDYYALAAIFKSTKTFSETRTGVIKHWHEHSFATKEELEELKTIDAVIAEKKKAATTLKNSAFAKIRSDARDNAAEYLFAATLFEPSMPLSAVQEIAKQHKLHPRILHHCRLHLEYNKDDPFFADWHRLVAAGNAEGVRTHYDTLFKNAATALAEAKKTDSAAKTISDPKLEAARLALNDLSGFLAVPPKVDYAFDEKTLKEYFKLQEAARLVESSAKDETSAMGVGEQKILTSLPIHIRGSHLNLGEPVQREFPEVMRTSSVRPILPANSSGRLELAHWMAGTQHPLTARVFVNRVWGWHFGRAMVGTTENFGKLGDRPTHPELLDWLARHFMQSGWSVKDLHRLILNSNTYQMASQHPESDVVGDKDPENHLRWKFGLQRLTAEQIRDSLLAVSGRLDLKIGGKTVPLRNRQFVFNHTSQDHTKYDSLRRAVYLPVIRNNLYTFFEQFDFPDPTMPTGHRSATVVAPQALLMMNSQLVMDCADEFATSILKAADDDTARVAVAYEKALGRSPTPAEVERALAFVGELTSQAFTAKGVDPADKHKAWSMFCHSLFASNEFIYLK